MQLQKIMQDAVLGWLGDYRRGMLHYDTLNPPTVGNQWRASLDELREFVEALRQVDPLEAWAELNDCVHTLLRLVVVLLCQIPLLGPIMLPLLIMLPAMGYKTARKHALRFSVTGCIRSPAHCLKQPPDHVCGRHRPGD